MREIYGATLAVVEPYQTVLTAIKPYEMAEHQAVLTVKYNTNITPAEGERRSECFTDYSRVLTPTVKVLMDTHKAIYYSKTLAKMQPLFVNVYESNLRVKA